MNFVVWTMAVETLVSFGHYVIYHLKTNPLLEDVRVFAEQSQEALRTAEQAFHTTVLAMVEAMAARDGKEDDLTSALRDLGHTVRVFCGNDYRAPLYKGYFPEGLADLPSTSPAHKVQVATQVLVTLKGETEPILQAHLQPITAALQEMQAAERLLAEARLCRAAGRTALDNEKKAFCANYREIHHKLVVRFRGNRRQASRYFRRVNRTHEEDEVPEAPAGQPVTAQNAAVQSLGVQNQGAQAAA